MGWTWHHGQQVPDQQAFAWKFGFCTWPAGSRPAGIVVVVVVIVVVVVVVVVVVRALRYVPFPSFTFEGEKGHG